MTNKLIANVPRIALFIGKESMLTPYIGSLYAALHSQGEAWTYADILAMSGSGNRLRWTPGFWDPANVDILLYEKNPFAPHLRALKAVGWEGEAKLVKPIIDGTDIPMVDAKTARRDIVASIDRNIPVIAMGIIGPPECCVVFGYEDDGEKLIGWNYFQIDEGFDANQPFVKQHWSENLLGYVLLKGKTTVPSIKDSGFAALTAIVKHAYQDEVRGAKVGIAAWKAMLHQLANDDFSLCTLEFPNGVPGEDITWQNSVRGRFMVYCDALCQIHERGVALPFYRKLAESVPEWADDLNQAIQAWTECSKYGGFLWKHMSNDKAGLEKFRTPELRKILADEGYRSMEQDIAAIKHIENLLRKIDDDALVS
jgi:hypothetical protein